MARRKSAQGCGVQLFGKRMNTDIYVCEMLPRRRHRCVGKPAGAIQSQSSTVHVLDRFAQQDSLGPPAACNKRGHTVIRSNISFFASSRRSLSAFLPAGSLETSENQHPASKSRVHSLGTNTKSSTLNPRMECQNVHRNI